MEIKTRIKKILGVDLSTSCVGFAVFEENGDLIEVTHAQPQHNFIYSSQMEDLYHKALMLKKFIEQKGWHKDRVTDIVIESPMISAGTIVSSAMLNKFHAFFFHNIYNLFSDEVKIHYIKEKDARAHAMPEICEKGKLWSATPKKIAGKKRRHFRKIFVMLQMAKRYPQVKWMLNNRKTLNQKNFDQADAIATALGFMVKEGIWKNEEKDIESSIKFIEKYFKYTEDIKGIKGSPSEKKELKKYYLKEFLKIEEQINLEVFE